MPARNRIKEYVRDGYYHVYNRGVDKRDIFLDRQDYRVFLSYIKKYLSSPSFVSRHHNFVEEEGEFAPVRLRVLKNFHDEIELLAYCLMPNHFHLLLKQGYEHSMTEFMRSLCTSYAMYFNKKYKRVGFLFQGPYKAVHISEEPYLLHLSRYIHLNHKSKMTGSDPVQGSYGYYVGEEQQQEWLHPEFILSFFKERQNFSLPIEEDFSSYKSFVENYRDKKDPQMARYLLDE